MVAIVVLVVGVGVALVVMVATLAGTRKVESGEKWKKVADTVEVGDELVEAVDVLRVGEVGRC